MHERRRKKFFTLPVLKYESKCGFLFLTNYKSKSKFTTQAWFVLSECKRSAISNNAPNLIMIGQKPCLPFNLTSYWPKRDSKAFPHPITAPIKRWFKVLDSLFLLWLVTSAKLNRELFLKQSSQSTVKKCLKERPSTCENVMLLRKNIDCINDINHFLKSYA